MKFTPSVVLDAPTYYVDHFNGKFDTDKCMILRNMQLETDSELTSLSMKHLPAPVQILDLTNNELTEFPCLRDDKDIHTLILSRNQISLLNGDYLPRNLANLVLCNNNIVSLEQLNGLRGCPESLRSLQLRGNAVIHLNGYREFVLQLLPNLKILDFSHIADKERNGLKGMRLSKRNVNSKNNVPDIMRRDKNLEIMHLVVDKMTDERKEELNQRLINATSLEEISRIEKLLSGGV